MNVEEIRTIIEKMQPFKLLGFGLEFETSDVAVIGTVGVSFISNIVNNRNLTLRFLEYDMSLGNGGYFIFLKISRVEGELDPDSNEVNFFNLQKWIMKKNIQVEENFFYVFPDEGNLEEQIRIKFNKYLEILNSEELSKIVRGEHWEPWYFSYRS
jgi:hypothetical protein